MSLKKILDKYKQDEGNTISVLLDIQDAFGYIPEDAVEWFSKKLDIPASRFFGITTFYSQFRLKPSGKNIIAVCSGTACHVKGSSKIAERIKKDLSLNFEGETTEDKRFTFEVVGCVGTCSIAPVVLVNNRGHGDMTVNNTSKLIKKLMESKGSDAEG
ncbi:MAG TPA: NAD(P)H-dependent oxidoreductase subunit E [Nitrospiraceae bacterium]|nr:NAD(P)H-dependent oxidoreductase subunit E [Nitrospiraceae bacterium]